MKSATLVLILLLVFAPGCATITGTTTGAFTGAVDLPSETYKESESVKDFPWLFAPMVVVTGTIGFGGGPLAGLVKGFSADIQWLVDWVSYGKIFGSFDKISIWRPWTFSIEEGRNQPDPADLEGE